MSGMKFLFWGYTVVWVGLAAYLAFLLMRLVALGKRLDRLERQLGKELTPSERAPAGSAPASR